MEKAIEIKRRAQRCVQNGDLDGALREYEKLVETPESDPYNFVLLADLLFKKGTQGPAAERYLQAVTAYEKAGLYKNAIAVCKKMGRLSLAQTQVLKHLGNLHQLDGLVSEASVYFAQFADQMLRANNATEAAAAYRKAFDCGQENVRFLEQVADALLIEGESARAAEVLREAAQHWQTRGQPNDARRCHDRANLADPSNARPQAAPSGVHATPSAARPPAVDPLAGFEPSRPAGSFTPTAPELPPAPQMPAAPAGGRTARAPGDPPAFSASGGFERSPQFVAPASPAEDHPAPVDEEPAVSAEGVYDIGAEAAGSYEHALDEVQVPPPATDPYARRGDAGTMSPSVVARRPVLPGAGVGRVENLLARAQEEFRSGRRDAASEALVEAAQAYEALGRLDSAATIFRSLGRGAQAPIPVMELWLANCEKRGDQVEGSQVACELGDRALNDGQDPRARGWFEHAAALDPANDTARRRLLRMSPKPAPPAPVANGEPVRRVEVAVGRAEAVTFDLEGLLAEFQRGVDTQLEGDAQGHYDMGMAYREMGLHEQALDSFRIAQRDPRLALLCHEMSGRSFADAGQHELAVREFTMGLKAGALDAAGEAELRYLTALSLAALGDPAGAVAQLEIADMRFPGRADITQRLAEWRRAFGRAA